MAIVVHCTCGHRFRCREEHAGRRAKCPKCGAPNVIPEKKPIATAAPSAGAPLTPPGDVAPTAAAPLAEEPPVAEHESPPQFTADQPAEQPAEPGDLPPTAPPGDDDQLEPPSPMAAAAEHVAAENIAAENIAPDQPDAADSDEAALPPLAPPPIPAASELAAEPAEPPAEEAASRPGEAGVVSQPDASARWHKKSTKKPARTRTRVERRESRWQRLTARLPANWRRRAVMLVLLVAGGALAWLGVDYLAKNNPFDREYVEVATQIASPGEPAETGDTPADSDEQRDEDGPSSAATPSPAVPDEEAGELNPIREIMQLEGMEGSVLALRLGENGGRVIAGDASGKLCVWDRYSGELLETQQMAPPISTGSGQIVSLAMSTDASTAIYSDDGPVLTLWRVNRPNQPYILSGHTRGGALVESSLDGALAVSVQGNTGFLWRLENGRRLGRLGTGNESYSSAAFSADGQRVALGSRGVLLDATTLDNSRCAVTVWNVANQQQLQRLEGHTGAVLSVAWSPKGEELVTASDDLTVRTWNVESGSQLQRLVMPEDPPHRAIYSPDGKYLLTANKTDTLQLWRLKDGRQICHLLGSAGPVTVMAFTPNGRFVVAGGVDRGVRVWELPLEK